MIQQLDLGDEQVKAYRVDGKISTPDVRKIIESIEADLKSPAQFKVYVEMPVYEGIEPEAMWERMKFGLGNLSKITKSVDKLAIVTDKRWLQNLARIYELFPNLEHKVYTFEETEKAREWIKR